MDLAKQDWLDALDDLIESEGPDRVKEILSDLQISAYRKGIRLSFSANTPYVNTIPVDQEVPYPGDREMERRIKSLIRWNAMAMVVRANRAKDGIGGFIETMAREFQPLMYKSASTNGKIVMVVDGHGVTATSMQERLQAMGTVDGIACGALTIVERDFDTISFA